MSKFLPFEQARDFARTLGFTIQREWFGYCKSGRRPPNIPADPSTAYKQEWKNWADWLGTAYLSFEEARAYIRSLGIKGVTEWRTYCVSGKKPMNIPSNANTVYSQKWKSWGDWLGTNTLATHNRVYMPFEDARNHARAKELKSIAEWIAYCKSGQKPLTLPTNPDKIYASEFQGWGDWLGTGIIATFNRVYLPFEKARDYVQAFHLKSDGDWRRYCKSGKKPVGIPSAPWNVYKGQWISLGDWLGTGTIASQQQKYTPEQRRKVRTAKGRNQHARRKEVQGSHTSAQIQEQLKRQKGKCYYAACGFSKFVKDKRYAYGYRFHIEHTFPLARIAGTDIPGNDMGYLVLACPRCNTSKGDRFPHEWYEGGRLL